MEPILAPASHVALKIFNSGLSFGAGQSLIDGEMLCSNNYLWYWYKKYALNNYYYVIIK